MDRRSKGLAFDEVGKERYMPTDLVMVPITVNLILIFGFIFTGAILFAVWEDWSPSPQLTSVSLLSQPSGNN